MTVGAGDLDHRVHLRIEQLRGQAFGQGSNRDDVTRRIDRDCTGIIEIFGRAVEQEAPALLTAVG